MTSQHPYAEVFIDEPHVFSVDISNATEVDVAVRSALAAIDKGQVIGCLITVASGLGGPWYIGNVCRPVAYTRTYVYTVLELAEIVLLCFCFF